MNQQIKSEFINKIYFNKEYILLFVLVLFFHLFTKFQYDDVLFSKYLINSSFMEFLIDRYHGWSSRIIIESVLTLLTMQDMIIWRILDSLLITVGIYHILNFINTKNNNNIAIIGILLCLMYPFVDMSSAGWMATTLNYSWCFILGIISMIPLINDLHGKKTNTIIYVVSVLALIYATNQEQCCGIIFGFLLIYLFNNYIKHHKINKYNIFALIIATLSLIFILTCPGNFERIILETATWYPEFANFDLFHKIYLGTVPTMGIFLTNGIIFPIFYIILNYCLINKINNKYIKCILIFNILFILSLTILKPLLINMFPSINTPLTIFTMNSIPPKDNNMIIAILISVYLLLSSFLMLVKNFGFENIFPSILFIGGFMSRFIIGFSPTIFASGPRTSLFFYMFLIIISLMLIKELFDTDNVNENQKLIMNSTFTILVVFNLINQFLMMPW